jgi:hypothetical protein
MRKRVKAFGSVGSCSVASPQLVPPWAETMTLATSTPAAERTGVGEVGREFLTVATTLFDFIRLAARCFPFGFIQSLPRFST